MPLTRKNGRRRRTTRKDKRIRTRMKWRRGGTVTYSPDMDALKLITTYVKKYGIFDIMQGSYGLTFVIKQTNQSIWSRASDWFRTMRRTKNPNRLHNTETNKPVRSCIIKMTILDPDSGTKTKEEKQNFETKLFHKYGLFCVTPDAFREEVKIQNDIFNKTNQPEYNWQAVCPNVLFSGELGRHVSKNRKLNDLFVALYDNVKKIKNMDDQNTLEDTRTLFSHFQNRLRNNDKDNIFQRNHDLQLGFIVMEYADGFVPAAQIANNTYKTDAIRFGYLQMTYLTGYTHNDTHQSNILLMPVWEKQKNMHYGQYYDSKHIHIYRPMVIDFGRAKTLSIDNYAAFKTFYEQGKYMQAFAFLCTCTDAHESYSNPENYTLYGRTCGNYDLDKDPTKPKPKGFVGLTTTEIENANRQIQVYVDQRKKFLNKHNKEHENRKLFTFDDASNKSDNDTEEETPPSPHVKNKYAPTEEDQANDDEDSFHTPVGPPQRDFEQGEENYSAKDFKTAMPFANNV